MCALVNGDSVGVGGKEPFTDLYKTLTALVEDRDDAALGRNVETTEGLIKGKDVRVCANGINGGHFLCVQIKQRELCILFAGHECQMMFAVDVESVAAIAAGQRVTSDELIFGRIDLG